MDHPTLIHPDALPSDPGETWVVGKYYAQSIGEQLLNSLFHNGMRFAVQVSRRLVGHRDSFSHPRNASDTQRFAAPAWTA